MATVHIQLKPAFIVDLDDLEFEKVKEHAQHHYDAVCQGALSKANGLVTNGFLTIAEMCKLDGKPYTLRLTSREFDTLCKITEFSNDAYIYNFHHRLLSIAKEAFAHAAVCSENKTYNYS